MPAQRLVFEGPTPESVILDACSEYGPEVQLSEPEEVRQGGMFGFFAKRAFRVQIADDSSAAPRGPGGPSAAMRKLAVPLTEPADSVLERMLAESPDVALDMVYERQPDATPEEAPTFAEALARAAGALGPELPGAVAPNDSFQTLVERLRRDELSNELFSTPEEPPIVATAEPVEELPVDKGAPKGLGKVFSFPRSEDVAEAPVQAMTPPPSATPRPLLADGLRAGSGRVVAALAAVAFPTQLLAAAAGRLPAGFGIEEVFGTLPSPRPLPCVPGTLIAVVGGESAAMRHARRIAIELGLDEEEIALARTTECGGAIGRHSRRAKEADDEERVRREQSPDLYVDNPEQGAALSPGWRRDRVGIVAVELPQTLEAALRMRAMLRAIRPSVTLLAAEASSKAADISYLAQGLGGIDALLLDNLAQTMTPAEILAAELPVRSLDGEPADPACWLRHVESTLDRRSAGQAD